MAEPTHDSSALTDDSPRKDDQPLSYECIHSVAARIWRSSGRVSFIDATDLANECFLRLARRKPLKGATRGVQVAYCVTIIRRLMIDEVRRRAAEPGIARPTTILTSTAARETRPVVVDLLVLDEALLELSAIDERQAKIVELRFFGGLDRTKAAEILDISVRTLTREWGLARSWLLQRLRG